MPPTDEEEGKTDRHATPSRRQLSWFLFFRILVITLLLSGTIFYQLQSLSERPAAVLPDLYLLVALYYLQVLLSAMVLRSGRWLKSFAQVQVAWDLLFCSALIYITGGVESPFSFLYILIILSAGFFLTRKGPFMAASAAAIFYGSLLDLQYYGYLPPFGHELIPRQIDPRDVFFEVFINVIGFFLTAFLGTTLVERLRKSEKALEQVAIDYGELEELNRTILANIGSGLMIIDPQGRIRSFNSAASRITRYSLEAVYNRDIREVFSDFRVFQEDGFKLVSRGEGHFVDGSGKPRVLGYATSLVKDPQEKTVGLLVTFQDLTRLKEIEAQLHRADRLAAVGRLASGMAHEIRNPLASISGSVQLLMEGEHVSVEDKRLMGIVVKEADRLSALLTDFLIYARPARPNQEEVDVSALLDELADMVASDRRFSGTEIRRRYPAGCRMVADRQQLRQALWNLMINAAEAMDSDGVLSLGVDAEGGAITIEDTGPGIPETIRDKIFDPFFTTKDRGTGLGLATVHTIVEAHHGTVEMAPGEGGGTRVTVRLPRHGGGGG